MGKFADKIAVICLIVPILFSGTIFLQTVYAGTLSCSITTAAACTGGTNRVILRMSSTTNAQAELPSQSTAAYANSVVCCSGVTGLSNSCSGSLATTSVLKLSSITNAHVEQKNQSNYANNACIGVPIGGNVSVGYQATDCSGYDTTLASMNATTNSHIGNSAAYSAFQICGTAYATAPTYSLSGNIYQSGSESAANSTSVTVALSINNGTPTTTTGRTGTYSFPAVSYNLGDILSVYIQGSSLNANAFAVAKTIDISGLNLYINKTNVSSYGSTTPLTNTGICSSFTYPPSGDNLFSCSGNDATFTSDELHVDYGRYAPIGNVTTPKLHINHDWASYEGDSSNLTITGSGIGSSKPFLADQTNGDTFTKLATTTAASGSGASASFSPDGTYLAVAVATTPFINIYKRSGDVFAKLTDPSAASGSGGSASFSPDATYLAVGVGTSPFINIYKRSGDVFTKLTDPSAASGATFGSSFSPDGTYLAVAVVTTPFINIYKRSGDVFTKLTNPSAASGIGEGASFSPDGTYLAVAVATTPFINIYKRSGDVFTKLTNPSAASGLGESASFSPDGRYLAVVVNTTPFINIYKRSGDVFTKLTNPSAAASTGFGVSFSPDGTYLSIGVNTSPFINIYKRSGDVFTKLTDPSAAASTGFGVSFSPDGTYLALAHNNSPFITVYRRGVGSFIAGTGTTTFTGTSATDIQPLSYGNLTIAPSSGSPTYTWGGTDNLEEFYVNGNLTVGNGNALTSAFNTYSPLLKVFGSMLIGNNATWTKGRTGSSTLMLTPSQGQETLTDSNTTKQDLGDVSFGPGIYAADMTVPAIQLASDIQVSTSTVADTGGKLDLNSNTLTVLNDWVNASSTLALTSGTVSFAGSGQQSILGTTTWNGFSITGSTARTVYFGSGQTQTIAASGSLTLQGQSGQLLNLVPTTPASAWKLAVSTTGVTQNLMFASTTYSDASGVASFNQAINAANNPNYDGTGNTNWLFPARISSISGNIYQSGSETVANSTPVSISLSINNTTPYTITSQTGSYSFGAIFSPGDILSIYINGNSLNANTFAVATSTDISGLNLYIDKTNVVSFGSTTPLTNTNICSSFTYPPSGDNLFSCSGNDVTFTSDELHIDYGRYAPIGNVTTPKLHINHDWASYEGDASSLTITGSGTGASKPLLADQTNTDTFNKLSPNVTTVGDVAYGTSFSPDGTYVAAVENNVSPNIGVYKRNGDTFTKLPGLAAASQSSGVAFSPDGVYLGLSSGITPFVHIYKRSGDTFNKLTSPANPVGAAQGIGFSPDGTYLVLTHQVSPFVTVYKRSADTFTALAALPAAPGIGRSVSFSPDGTYMAVAHQTTPFVTVYKRSGDTFTKLPALAAAFAAATNGYSVSFSPDGTYLSIAGDGTPFISVYKRSGDTFTKLPNLTAAAGAAMGGSFSPDGTYLALAVSTTPFINIYKRSGDTFTKQTDPTAGAGAGNAVSFAPDGNYLAVGGTTAPFLTIYRRGVGSFWGGTGTTTFTGTSNTDLQPLSYGNLTLAPSSGSPTYTWGNTNDLQEFYINGNLTVGNSNAMTSALDTYAPILKVFGSMLIGNNATWTHDATGTSTIYFKPTGTDTITDNNTTKQDLGDVSFGPGIYTPTMTVPIIQLASDIKVSTSTIADTGGKIDLNSNTLTVMNDWVNSSSTLAFANGTVSFAGAGQQSILGTTTWKNLSITGSTARTVYFGSGQTQTIAASGSLTLTGATGQLLNLMPTTPALAWKLAVSTTGVTQSITYASTTYSNATGIASFNQAVNAISSSNRDGGSNTNWIFAPTITIAGNIYQSGSESSANSTPVSISLSINNGAPTTITGQTSGYSFPSILAGSGDIITTYIDGNALDANAIAVAGNTSFSNLNLFINKTNLTSYASSTLALTNTNLCAQSTYPTAGDVLFTCSSGSPTFTGDELHLSGRYAPGSNVTTPKLHIASDGGSYEGSTENLTISGSGTNTSRPLLADLVDTWSNLPNAFDTIPGYQGNAQAFSHDGNYFAAGTNETGGGSTYLYIYKRSGDNFTKLANPVTLPTGVVFDVDFSPDGTYLAVGSGVTPFLLIYKRSGDTFTKLANPTLPPSQVNVTRFSPDGQYLAVGNNASPSLRIYKRSGDTFTLLAIPTWAGGTSLLGMGWSSDGAYLSIGATASPFLFIYKHSGDTFTLLPAQTTPNASATAGDNPAFSPDGKYLSMTVDSATPPVVVVYKRSGDTFTKLSNLPAGPATRGKWASFSPDGQYLAVDSQVTPYLFIYKQSGDTFSLLPQQATIPGNNGNAVDFSPDGKYLVVDSNSDPAFYVYKTDSGIFSPAAATTIFTGTSNSDIQPFVYNNLTFAPASGSPTYSLGSSTMSTFYVNGNLTVGDGLHAMTADLSAFDPYSVLNGNLLLNALTTWVQSANDFNLVPIATATNTTLTDNNSTKQDLGNVSFGPGVFAADMTAPNIQLGTDINVSSSTIREYANSLDLNSNTLTVNNDWLNASSTLAFTTGTVSFAGSGNQTITGTTTWNNLSVTGTTARTVYFGSGQTQTIGASGGLTFQGAAGQLLNLMPTTPASAWKLAVSTTGVTQSITYASTTYSNATGVASFNQVVNGTASSNVDGGNNTNWTFPAAYSIAGNIYQSGSESSANSTPVSVSVSVNNGTPTTLTSQTGSYSFPAVVLGLGDIVTTYINGNALDANAITVATSSNITNLNLYINKTNVSSYGSTTPLTNTGICSSFTYPPSGDNLFSCSGNDATFTSDELHVDYGRYAPIGNVTTPKLHINHDWASYEGDASNLTITGSGTGASKPLLADQTNADNFTKLATTTAVTGTGWGVDFSPDGTYLAFAANTAPYITVYKRDGDTFTKLPALTDPAGAAQGVAFSPDGVYMSVAHGTSPFMTVYKRSGDTFTKLSDPAAAAGTGRGVDFSPDGTYVALAHTSSPFITVYKRSGDTFTKLSALTAPSGIGPGYGAAFSPDGTYLSLSYEDGSHVAVYKRSGDTFTKLPDLTSIGSAGQGVSFSPDGTYLSVASFGSPYISVYKRSGDTFTLLPAITAAAGAGQGVSFSSDGKYVSLAHSVSPFITVYKRSGDTFTKLSALPAANGAGRGTVISPDGTYVALAHNTTPFITIYRRGVGDFWGGTGTTTFTGTSATDIQPLQYGNLTLAPSSGSPTYTWGDTDNLQEFYVNGNLTVGNGNALTSTIATYSPLLKVFGNLLIGNNVTWTKGRTGSSTLMLKASGTDTITDNNATKQDLGDVSFGPGIYSADMVVPQVQLTSNIKTSTSTIADTGGKLDLNSNTLTVLNDWVNASSTLALTSGTVSFAGSGQQSIIGTTTWNNLSVTGSTARTVYFGSSQTQTIGASGSLTFQGAAGQLLNLMPTTPASAWQLAVSTTGVTQNITYASTTYSDASGVTSFNQAVNATSTSNVDGGNNTNWNFPTAVSCSSSITSTSFGTLDSSTVFTASSNATTTSTCGSATGCTLYVSSAGNGTSAGLYAPTATGTPIILSSSASLLAGFEGYGIQGATSAAGSGATLAITSPYNVSGNQVGGLSTSNLSLASSTAAFTAREVVVTHKAAVSDGSLSGNYSDTVTYSCTAN